MDFLNHPDMWPFQFSQIKGDKPKKMNKKEDKEFADDLYIPVYTFAFPVEVGLVVLLVSKSAYKK